MADAQHTVAGLMELVSEYGHSRWSEGSSGATHLDRVGERRMREEAFDLYKQIEAYAAALAHGVTPCGEVVVTKDASGAIVLVSRQDEDGRILSVIAEPGLTEAQQAGFAGLARLHPTNPPVSVDQRESTTGVGIPGEGRDG
jgi:hypothetical protein